MIFRPWGIVAKEVCRFLGYGAAYIGSVLLLAAFIECLHRLVGG
jgi:hypothetical protein